MAAIRLIGGEQPLNGLAHVFSQTVVVLLLVPIMNRLKFIGKIFNQNIV